MPPLEALKVLLSLMMSGNSSQRHNPLKLRILDISCAHFYGRAQRKLYITLPEEDAEPGKVGLLLNSMYGCQDVAACWELECTQALLQSGFTRDRSNGAVF